MPTLLIKNGFRFFFYSREFNEPPHVHVIGRGGEMKTWLHPIKIDRVYDLNAKDQKQVMLIVFENSKLFLEKWKEYHGTSAKKNS